MRRAAWTVALVLCVIVFCATPTEAQNSTFYFPYIVNDSQIVTDLIFTNVSGRDATVSLSGYGEDATVFAGTAVSVPANSQVVVGASALGGLRGWLIGSTAEPGIAGNVRVSSPNRAAQETTEPAEPGNPLIFPLAAQSSGASTEISIVNPSPFPVRAISTLYDKDGLTVAINDSVLAPFGMLRGSIAALFGVEKNYGAASHVIARLGPPNIFSPVQDFQGLGFEIVRGYAQNDVSLERITPRKDWAAFNATPASSGNISLTLPQVIRGFDWFSIVGLVNSANTAQNATLTYSTATNANAGTKNISIPANGSARMTATDLFGLGQDSGFVRVAASGKLAAFVALGTFSGSALATAPAPTAAQAEFFFPGVNEAAPAMTGIALLNDGTVRATVDIFLITAEGLTLGRATELVEPHQRSVKMLREFIPRALNAKDGFIFARSSVPIFGMAITGDVDRTLNESTARATFPGYIPPPVLPAEAPRFQISGTVTDFGSAAPAVGVTLTLSKPGSTDVNRTTTGANGAYVFGNLLAGDYNVAPSQAGRAFTPVTSAVQVSTANVVLNFTREVLPGITTVTVITSDGGPQSTAGNNPGPFAVFGTAEVVLRIEGVNFVGPAPGQAGQRVFFGAQALPPENVTFADSQTIFVRLVLNSPAILAEIGPRGFYGSYDITVGGQPPFESSRSNAVTFYIVPPVPVLTTVDPVETNARYEIDSPGQTLTVTGFGFRNGARLLFDGGTALNGIEVATSFISSTRLQAYLPPQALRYGGLYILRVRNVSQFEEISGEAVTFQVNNLRPQISSLYPPADVLQRIWGPGTSPVLLNLAVNGSNFYPGTTTSVALKIPDVVPALVPVDGPQICAIINERRPLQVRVLDSAGHPLPGIIVTFRTPGGNTNLPSGYFTPAGVITDTITVVSDGGGLAPGSNNPNLFLANPFPGSYVVTATAVVDGIALVADFNLINIRPGEPCPAAGTDVSLVSSQQLIVNQFPIAAPGTYSVIVSNPSPGGGVSNEVDFVVGKGPASNVPAIRVLVPFLPASRQAGTAGFNLTVFGDFPAGVPFAADAWVNFGTVRLNRVANDLSAASITVFVPSYLITSAGLVPISVTNPGNDGSTGGTSTRTLFAVTP